MRRTRAPLCAAFLLNPGALPVSPKSIFLPCRAVSSLSAAGGWDATQLRLRTCRSPVLASFRLFPLPLVLTGSKLGQRRGLMPPDGAAIQPERDNLKVQHFQRLQLGPGGFLWSSEASCGPPAFRHPDAAELGGEEASQHQVPASRAAMAPRMLAIQRLLLTSRSVEQAGCRIYQPEARLR